MSSKRLTGFCLSVFVLSMFFNFGLIKAAAPGAVVINEIAWAGSKDNANDEWLELYNTTGADIDLAGWSIEDDGVPLALSGIIPAYGYFLIEDSEATVNPNLADLIVNLSLANTGDSLILKDNLGSIIDAVNSSGGMWFSGNSVSKATMERIDPLLSGDNAVNWATSTGSGATSSLGSEIIGTPGALNSVSQPQIVGATVSMAANNSTLVVGDRIVVNVNIDNVVDLFSYGFDVYYDPTVLSYVSSVKGSFLSSSGTYATSFQSGLEDGVAGKLVVAEARTIDPKVGTSGSGNLYSMTFDVVGGEGLSTSINFGEDSFIADTAGEVATQLVPLTLSVLVASAEPVTNLAVAQGLERYSINVSWTASLNASTYKVFRKDAHGNYIVLGETAATNFVDSDLVSAGGKIIPTLIYSYRVIAIRSGVESIAVDASGADLRGIKGDNDRSDRVDGRDLDNLARHFAEADSDNGFDALLDTTYDGFIDGNDLIDLGVNFALTYQ
jgi:hypothetical protein